MSEKTLPMTGGFPNVARIVVAIEQRPTVARAVSLHMALAA